MPNEESDYENPPCKKIKLQRLLIKKCVLTTLSLKIYLFSSNTVKFNYSLDKISIYIMQQHSL